MTEKEFRERERNAAMKKNAAKKKRKKRKKAITAVIVTLLILIAVLILLAVTLLFRIESVVVEGNTVYSDEQIISVTELTEGKGLFLFSAASVSDKAEKLLPFISKLTVKRELPSTVYLTVEETQEEICFLSGGEYCSADRQGKILNKYSSKPEGMTAVVTGGDYTFTVGEYFVCTDRQEKDMLDKLMALFGEQEYRITVINVADIYDSYIVIEDRLAVEFGSSVNFDKKLAHFKAMLGTMSGDETGIVDLGSWTPDKPEAFFTEKDINEYIN